MVVSENMLNNTVTIFITQSSKNGVLMQLLGKRRGEGAEVVLQGKPLNNSQPPISRHPWNLQADISLGQGVSHFF